jgi:nucleotide-binding universal stress UspA family protein
VGAVVAAVGDDTAGRRRIAIPVPADRTPIATTRCAVAIARQGGFSVEFVGAAGGRGASIEQTVRQRCAAAIAVGAPRVSWQVVDGGPAAIGPYITWSGASLCCVGTVAHRHASTAAAAGAGAVPLLVVGPCCRPSDSGYRHLVVGLDSGSDQSEHVAATAVALAARMAAEVTLIEVVAPGRTVLDVPPSAHLYWVASGLDRPPRLFDTVAARRAAPGLARFLDPGTVVVVGAPGHHRSVLGGVAGRLVRRAPCPVLVVPAATAPRTCCTAADRPSRSRAGTRTRAAPMSRA